MPQIETINASLGSGPICEAMARDGACIVEDAVGTGYLTGLNNDLDALIAATELEGQTPRHSKMADFYGKKTIRMDGILAKSETFVQYMSDPLMHEVCQRFIRPNCDDYLLNVTQMIRSAPEKTHSDCIATKRLGPTCQRETWSLISRRSSR